jgi:hypothetical protein
LRIDLLTDLDVDERVVLQDRKCPRSQSLLVLSCNHSNEGTLMTLVTMLVKITLLTTRTIVECATFVTKVCKVSDQISYKCTYVFKQSARYFCPTQRTATSQALVKIPNFNFHSDMPGRNFKSFMRTDGRTPITEVIVGFRHYFANATNNES